MLAKRSNLSPIADGAIALIALAAKPVLKSKNSERLLPIESFYRSYKVSGLKENEIISVIMIPVNTCKTSFLKTGKRAAVDIASVNSAISLKIDNDTIMDARLALGGVAPIPILANKTNEFLIGKVFRKRLFSKLRRLHRTKSIRYRMFAADAISAKYSCKIMLDCTLSGCFPNFSNNSNSYIMELTILNKEFLWEY